MKLRCYCCGEDIAPGDLFLVQYTQHPNPGRVFTMKGEHIERIDDTGAVESARYLEAP